MDVEPFIYCRLSGHEVFHALGGVEKCKEKYDKEQRVGEQHAAQKPRHSSGLRLNYEEAYEYCHQGEYGEDGVVGH